MKKHLFTTVFCLLSVCAFSQIDLGVKAGLNLADFSGDDLGDSKMRPSYLAGAYLGIGLGEKFAIQPEVLFVSSGSKFEDGSDKSTYKLNYISIPIMFKYKIVEMFNVQAGPQIGILASAKNEIETGGNKTDVDIKDSLKSSDFGLAVGAGLDFGKFNVSARYCFGLSDISDNGSSDSSVKNTGIQIALGYSLFSFGD
jgi:hypothetical protein